MAPLFRRAIMRKKRIVNLALAFAAAYFLTGCGNPGSEVGTVQDAGPGEETVQNAGAGEETVQNPGSGEEAVQNPTSGEEAPAPDSSDGEMGSDREAGFGGEAEGEMPFAAGTEVSDQKVTVSYTGEPFQKSVFAVGSETLYICGEKEDGNYFLGYMGKEEDVFREMDAELKEGMSVLNMAGDRQGRCHILWMSVEKVQIDNQELNSLTFESSIITVVDSQGKVEKEIDISDIFAGEQWRPFCFAVDDAGNYYLEKENKLVRILPDGRHGEEFASEGWIDGIGTGKSGSVYCTVEKEDGTIALEKLEEDGIRPWMEGLPESNAIYAGIYPGTDSELLLINKESGIFAVYDGGSIETRVSRTELPVTGEAMGGYGILADGRACILSQEPEKTVFYYIPAGK